MRGPEELFDQLDTERLRASVDATPFLNMPPGTYDVTPAIRNLPTEIAVESQDYDTLRLIATGATSFQFRTVALPVALPIALPVAPLGTP